MFYKKGNRNIKNFGQYNRTLQKPKTALWKGVQRKTNNNQNK